MTHILLFYPQLMSAMTNKLSKQEDPLPQDLAEGVDEDEWVRQQTNIPVIDFYMLVSCIHGYFCYFFFQFHFLQEFASNVKYVDQAQLAIKVERMGQC